MTIASHTLGCKLNFAETSHILRQFSDAGYQVCDFDKAADIYVINTCTVTSIAEKKCRTAIHHAHRMNPDAFIAVIGCFAQIEGDKISKMPGVSLVLGNDRKNDLFAIVSQQPLPATRPFPIAYSSGDRTRSFLKIQDGCDYFCTYCAIPFARGRSRSATISQVVEASQTLARQGIKEIVLTGVNTGTFGNKNGETFLQLLQALDQVEGIERYRISSIEPNLLTDEIVHFVAGSRAFLPHFHIPLQAGSNKVLRLMHRHYDTDLYADKIHRIKSQLPDACIAADIIAGFNGEDESTFDETCRFVEGLPLSYLHVFTYSDRPNTKALTLSEKIPVGIRRQHSQRLHELSDKKKNAFYNSQKGTRHTVLWESSPHTEQTSDQSYMQGWTDNYIRLQRPFDPTLVNTITWETVDDSTVVHNFKIED